MTCSTNSLVLFFRDMAVPPQQQTAPNDHHYFEWSTTSQQKLVEQSLKVVPIGLNQPSLSTNNVHTNNSTNMVHNHPHLQNHPLMTHTHRRHYYQHFEEKRSFEDSKPKLTKAAPGMTPPNTNNSISLSPSPGATNFTSTGHVRKKQKTNTNGIGSASSTSSLNTSDDHSQSQVSKKIFTKRFCSSNNMNGTFRFILDLLSISSRTNSKD